MCTTETIRDLNIVLEPVADSSPEPEVDSIVEWVTDPASGKQYKQRVTRPKQSGQGHQFSQGRARQGKSPVRGSQPRVSART
jgi:hypothetical protein